MSQIPADYCVRCYRWIAPGEEKEIIGVQQYHARCADILREEQNTRPKQGMNTTALQVKIRFCSTHQKILYGRQWIPIHMGFLHELTQVVDHIELVEHRCIDCIFDMEQKTRFVESNPQ